MYHRPALSRLNGYIYTLPLFRRSYLYIGGIRVRVVDDRFGLVPGLLSKSAGEDSGRRGVSLLKNRSSICLTAGVLFLFVLAGLGEKGLQKIWEGIRLVSVTCQSHFS
jgi:hypothetical protein